MTLVYFREYKITFYNYIILRFNRLLNDISIGVFHGKLPAAEKKQAGSIFFLVIEVFSSPRNYRLLDWALKGSNLNKGALVNFLETKTLFSRPLYHCYLLCHIIIYFDCFHSMPFSENISQFLQKSCLD